MTADDAMDIENMTSKKSPRVDDSESSFADIEKPGMTRAQDTESPKSNTGFDSMSSVHSENSMLKYVSRNSYRRAAGSSYVLAMAVSGLVLIALASSLEDLAKMVHRSSIEVSFVQTVESRMTGGPEFSEFPRRRGLSSLHSVSSPLPQHHSLGVETDNKISN